MLIGVCISVLSACDPTFNSKVRTELYPHFWEYECAIQWYGLLSTVYTSTIFLQIPDYQPDILKNNKFRTQLIFLGKFNNKKVEPLSKQFPLRLKVHHSCISSGLERGLNQELVIASGFQGLCHFQAVFLSEAYHCAALCPMGPR